MEKSITFGVLRTINTSLRKNNDEVFLDFINSIDGDNTFKKFKNFLKLWESDVSNSLSFNIKDTPTKIQLAYIISDIPDDLGGEIIVEDDNFRITLDIPSVFTNISDTILIYDVIKNIELSDISINLSNLNGYDKHTIIDNLPAKLYSDIINIITHDKTKTVKFSNQLLSNFNFNFYTIAPISFLKSLFLDYGEDYFRDIIFYLSKRIDGRLLMDSTILDVEYFLERYLEEVNQGNNQLTPP